MKILRSRSKQRIAVIIIILLLALVVYLNRTYAHIYNIIGRADLQSSDQTGTYLIKANSNLEKMIVTEAGLANNSASTSLIIYVALGDSLTAGVGTTDYGQSYPYLLSRDLAADGGRPVELYDRSIPGEKSAGIIKDLLPEAVKDKPDMITLFIGINDIHGLISAQTFKHNYETILQTLTAKTKAKIYVVNLPYLGAPNLIRFPYSGLLDWRTQEFNRIIKEQAVQYSVNYVDLYTPTLNLFKKSGDLYSADSFHPSALGYKLWANIIYASINK